MKYRIELLYFYGWDDAGWTDAIDDNVAPVRFDSAREAQAALIEYFTEVDAAIVRGDMAIKCQRQDYRIIAQAD